MKISKVSEMRELDKKAVDNYSIKDELLMENAGEASYYAILRELGIKNNKFIIICGSGNNGGDGLVVARKLNSMGAKVKIFFTGNTDKYTGASELNYQIIKKLKLDIISLNSADSIKIFEKELKSSDVIIDAIFGTGLTHIISGIYIDIISLINNSNKTIVSLDIPSGIEGDSGRVMGTAVKADYTVAFGLPKPGNILYPGYEYCGKLYCSHISFPEEMYKDISIETNNPPELPERNPDGHKGAFGDVLFIAGAASYYGAPCFSALSFLKAGGGYSRLASPDTITPYISSGTREIVHIPLKSTDQGSISFSNKDRILQICEKIDMVIIGPGLSLNEDTQKLVRELVAEIKKPLLIDGDGLTALSPDSLKRRNFPTILTPHPGEMAGICGTTVQQVKDNRIDLARETAERLNACIVLKGAHSIIAFPDRRIFINLSGNSGMATAGSGDVLTGTIAAMSGLGLKIDDSVKAGVFIHGLSGDLAAAEIGEDGITANDILEYLPRAVKFYRENYEQINSGNYNKIHEI